MHISLFITTFLSQLFHLRSVIVLGSPLVPGLTPGGLLNLTNPAISSSIVDITSVDSLGEVSNRAYQCSTQSGGRSDWPHMIDCLNLMLRIPTGGENEDLKHRTQGGYIPILAKTGKCAISLDFTDESVTSERTNWQQVHTVAGNLIFLCGTGGENRRTGGTVVFGQNGKLRLKLGKEGRGNAVDVW